MEIPGKIKYSASMMYSLCTPISKKYIKLLEPTLSIKLYKDTMEQYLHTVKQDQAKLIP